MLPRFSPLLAALAFAALLTGARCDGGESTGQALFASPQVRPIVLSRDGARLYVANTTSHSVSVISTFGYRVVEEIPVGLEPVSLALRPDGRELWVSNHVSDSVSVIDTDWRSSKFLRVVATIQDLDPQGVTRFDEPAGIAFASDAKAYVALSSRNEIAVVDIAPPAYEVRAERIRISAQEPRAIAVRDGRLYVAAFESGNQSELSICREPDGTIQCTIGTLQALMSSSPNLPGLDEHIVLDPDLPDRDLFVFDTADESLIDVVSHVGTLLYGLAVDAEGRVFVTQTDARNTVNGLEGGTLVELDNRIFMNRIAVVYCGGSACRFDPAGVFELEPPPPARPQEGRQLATPYGIALAEDGSTVVATAAASSRLFTLDPERGTVLDVIDVGAIPRGVALRSKGRSGAPETAYTLDTLGNTVTVVDVRRPGRLRILRTIPVGNDPTPPAVRSGRIAFNDAGASSSGTFACASCHPDAHTDQLLWRIGGACSPERHPACGGDEPRTTQPIRGLRNTLPLHWDGTLGDPFGGGNGAVGRTGDGGIDCSLEDADGDHDCFLDLVRASLAGVMCDQTGSCPRGGDRLSERSQHDMATFLASVWHPPARSRRLDDSVSAGANDGFADFFVDQGGFDRGTCADPRSGCHELPLGAASNGSLDGFDAPSLRGLTDRFVQFSNAPTSSEEVLVAAAAISEFPWDPGVGHDERVTFAAAFNTFRPIYGVTPVDIMQMLEEASTGTSGATGRQVTLTRGSLGGTALSETSALLDALEDADARGVVELRGTAARRQLPARVPLPVAYRAERDAYQVGPDEVSRSELEAEVRSGALLVALTAHLPIRFGEGIHRQPLLAPLDVEGPTGIPALPLLPDDDPLLLLGIDVRAGAGLVLDGRPVSGSLECRDGSFEPEFCNSGRVEIHLDALPSPAGLHLLQIQNPAGPLSNELPICVGTVPSCR